MSSLTLKSITKSYNGTPVCNEISLEVASGEFFTFLGPSGCGKTTTLRLISGFVFPETGSIHLGEKEITHLAPEKRQVGLVFQNYALFPFLNVGENVAYGLKVQKLTAAEIQRKVDKYLELVGLTGFAARKTHELSGGEQQRVAVARSLATEPKVLLLDEPLSNLDAQLRLKMRAELKTIQQQLGITTIFVTHDQSEAMTTADRIAVFNQGRIMQTGTPREIYDEPASSFIAGFIGETNLFPVGITDGVAILGEEIHLRLKDDAVVGHFISIRPQNIVLSEADSGTNSLEGQITSVQINSGCLDIQVRTGSLRFQVTTLNTPENSSRFIPGSATWLTIAPEVIRVIAS